MANNATYPLGPIAPGVRLNAVAVTPGATIFNPPLTALYVGGAGNITITMAQTGSVTLTAVPAGTMLKDIAILSVTAAAATGLIGFF